MANSLERARSFIGTEVTVTMDRPMGSTHPKFGFEYTENYGYLDGVMAPDGEFLDAYVLKVGRPVPTAKGVCIAVVHRIDDDDDKLVVVPQGITLTDEEIIEAVSFQEKFFKTEIVR